LKMTNIIIVDSVKGGCGKTTEAIASAIRSNLLDKKKTCVIDMDILGTSIEQTLMGKCFVGHDPIEKFITHSAKKYLNDLAEDPDTLLKSKDCISNIILYTPSGEANVSFILSSPYDKDKRRFKLSGSSNYTVQITPTHFRGVINKLINHLIDDEYETIIFDMPPNSDVYTDCVFDLFLDAKNPLKDISVELVVVSTYDRAHIYSNTEWLVSFYEGKDHNWKPFDKITFLLNNNSYPEFNDSKISLLRASVKEYIETKLPHSPEARKINIAYRSYDKELVSHFLYKDNSYTDFSAITASWFDIQII